MSKISIQIPEQNYEIICKKIGEILADELANQTYTANFTVWYERTIRFDKSEIPAINVFYAGTEFTSNTPINQDAKNTYYIDVYASAPFNVSERGDVAAMYKLKRILGIIRYILESQEYIHLDFDKPLIRHTEVTNISVVDITSNEQDQESNTRGRVAFEVLATEGVILASKILLGNNITTVLLSETDKGFKYILNS